MARSFPALQILQKMGLVHRDISPGNILFDPESRKGKLGDLEYYMEFDRTSPDVHSELIVSEDLLHAPPL